MRELSILEMLNDLDCGDKKETTVKMEGRNSMPFEIPPGYRYKFPDEVFL